MALNSLHDLFVEQLKDLYNAEVQLTFALPKMSNAASHEELREAFDKHLKETKGHVQRLEKIFNKLGLSPTGEKCEAMEGLIKEGEHTISMPGDPSVKDAALIAAAQRVEHYEIAGYGCVVTYAKRLGYSDAASILEETLQEEGHADKKLTKLAEGGIMTSSINKEATKK